jgi:choline dehydrogenase-like flavoprotein
MRRNMSCNDFAARVRLNQEKLRSELKSRYDFIVCGAGSSGSVVARRLAENPSVRVLLLEAGGSDEAASVMEPGQWMTNLGGERDWRFTAQRNPHVNGRSISLSMGKVLGGGSSINLMVWARGHQSDWDFFAQETGDPAWCYDSVLNIYQRLEDWRGAADPEHRGTGGPVFVQPAPNPHPLALAMLAGARVLGIPTFANQNGRMMEGNGGAAVVDVRVRDGKRQSVFRSYTYPFMDRPNLTVLTGAVVRRLTFEGKRATGVELIFDGKLHLIHTAREVILSLGAMHTPKVLMQSGIGDEAELRPFDIPVVEHLPGVGQNFQDHPGFHCTWESKEAVVPRNNGAEATLFWQSMPHLESPNWQMFLSEIPRSTPENIARFGIPARGWTLAGCLVRPQSRGCIRLTGSNPDDPVQIEANHLSHSDDARAAIAGVQLAREIGNSAELRQFATREVMPGNLTRMELDRFVRNAAVTFWHASGTAKMGRDAMSVVDGRLAVYGIENLRIADGSIMPRVTTGNTMAPCVVIGERCAEILRSAHRL